MNKSIFLLLFTLFITACSKEHREQDPYNLNLLLQNPFKWSVSNLFPLCLPDTTQKVDGKYRLSFVQHSTLHRGEKDWTQCRMYQRIVLPRNAEDEITFSIRDSCSAITSAWFCVNRYNEHMQLLSRDSVDIRTDSVWQNHTLTLSANAATRIVDLEFMVKATDKSLPRGRWTWRREPYRQALHLEPMSIKIGGKDIASWTHGATLDEMSNPVVLEAAKKTDIKPGSDGVSIPLNPQAKIVAIGETTHYNEEVSQMGCEVIKDRILHHNCRLVMMELPCNKGLLANYYASGVDVEPDFVVHLQNLLIPSWTANQLAFLEWLRSYNQGRDRKVLLVGTDILGPQSRWDFPELEVLHAAFRSKGKRDEIQHIVEDIAWFRYQKAQVEIAKQAPLFREVLGEESFDLFDYVFKHITERKDSIPDANGAWVGIKDSLWVNRDLIQYRTAQKYLTSYLLPNETAVVYSHFGHASRTPLLSPEFNLGYYLSQAYGERYCPIAIVVGSGEGTTFSFFTGVQNFTFSDPPRNSIEFAAKQLSSSPFYYPFDDRNFPLSFIRHTGVSWGNMDINQIGQFLYLISPKGVADGFIYVPQGSPIRSVYNSPKREEAIEQSRELNSNRLSQFRGIDTESK